jgi:hypothetical protein
VTHYLNALLTKLLVARTPSPGGGDLPSGRSQRSQKYNLYVSLHSKLVLTWPTSGGRSVGIVRFRTQATEFFMDNISCLQHVYIWRRSPDGVLALLVAYFLIAFLASSSTLKLEAVRSSETSVNFFRSTLRHIPWSSNLHSHHYEYIKFYLFMRIWSCIETSKHFYGTSELRIRNKKYFDSPL